MNRHRFLARGGELLFLQLCNALRQDIEVLREWSKEADLSLSEDEYDPERLYVALNEGFERMFEACPKAIGELAEFIDLGVDSQTCKVTDYEDDGQPKYTRCGWCPAESWQEGFLFAVEISRILNAVVDPIKRIELLETACAMQVLRSLSAQSARNVEGCLDRAAYAGPLLYCWAISDPEGKINVAKKISQRCVRAVQRMIYDAIRIPEIRENVDKQQEDDRRRGKALKDPYKDADKSYGNKLFIKIAKSIGLIVPKRGAGARFVLNDKLLQYLVLSTIRPGNRVTYESFKGLVFAHYGIALDADRLIRAYGWCGINAPTTIGDDTDEWIMGMLEAAGMLRRLSDSQSLVMNPFYGGG
jgi:hypothetical protein